MTTPYSDEKTSDFVIPRDPSTLITALGVAQRDYEDAKVASEKATQSESDAGAKRKTLKRDLINSMRQRGIAVSRAEKEYVDEDEWKKNEEDIAIHQDKERSALVDESIARQRMLTLRASIIPVTAMFSFAKVEVQNKAIIDALAKATNSLEHETKAVQLASLGSSLPESAHSLVDASMTNAHGDEAHSDDASVAHNA